MANLPQHQGNAHQAGSLAQLIANLGPQSAVIQQSKVDPRSLAAGIQPSFADRHIQGQDVEHPPSRHRPPAAGA